MKRLLMITAYRACSLCCVCVCCVFLMSVYLITDAKAIAVKPMVLELSASGSKSKATFRVFNDTARVLPVEITPAKLDIDENGQATRTRADGTFMIFPPRVVLQPGKSQTIQIRWLGKPNIAKSEIFMLTANELPVQFNNNEDGVNVVMAFSILMNVSPAKSKANLELVSSKVVEDKRKNRRPFIEVRNTGNRHAMIMQTNLIFKSGNWRKKLAPADIFKDLGSFGVIQPGKRRKFWFKTVLPPEISSFDVDIQLPEGR